MSIVDLPERAGQRPPGQAGGDLVPAIVLCGGLAERGLDLDAVGAELRARAPLARVEIVDDLCNRPRTVAAALRRLGATRAVFGLCHRGVGEAELLARARGAGLEPFGAELVKVPLARGPAGAALALAASVAHLESLSSGETGRVAPSDQGFSRRALFSLASAVTVRPVALTDAEACVGHVRCGLCTAACPHDAIEPEGSVVRVVAARCEGCGECVSACPAGALHLAGAAPAQIRHRLDVLLDDRASRGVLYACQAATAELDRLPDEEHWSVVDLPALSVATVDLVLQTLAAGARAVRLLPCQGACCAGWRDGPALSLCRALAGAAGESRVALATPASLAEILPVPPRRPMPSTAAAAILELAPPDLLLESDRSPLGALRLDESRCTLCGACAQTCPTSALSLDERDPPAVVLRHDPRACSGCGLCVTACPERAIRVTRAVDVARLRAGRIALARGVRVSCRACGALLPPAQATARVRERLGDRWAELAEAPDDLCADCRARGRGRP